MDTQEPISKPEKYRTAPGCCITERIQLRPFERQDAEAITQLISNWNVIKMLAVPPWPYLRKDAEEFIDRTLALPENDPTWVRVIIDRQTDVLMGVVGIERRDDAVCMGYWLGEPFWGKGFMTEAVRAMLSMRFEADPEARIESAALKENAASLRIQEKLGFRVVGEGLMYCRPRGTKEPEFNTLLIREDFERAIA